MVFLGFHEKYIVYSELIYLFTRSPVVLHLRERVCSWPIFVYVRKCTRRGAMRKMNYVVFKTRILRARYEPYLMRNMTS